MTAPLPFTDGSLDLCFMATVLHILGLAHKVPPVLAEVRRVLRPGGRLAVLECKKEDQPWGPPLERRIDPRDLEAVAVAQGFEPLDCTDLGVMYLARFAVPGRPA